MILGHQELLHGDCVELIKTIVPKADLIIADPPYWKVINQKWDYKWRTETDYIEWCKKWLNESYNKLRIGGTLYLFGYFKTLVLLIPFLQKIGFEIKQQIIINKGLKSIAGRATKNYKMFPNTTESLLLLVKDNKEFSKNFLKERQKILHISSKDINKALGVKSNGGGMWSIYTGKNVCKQFPTKENWEKLENILQFNIPYNKISQTFNQQMGLTDVWSDIDFYLEKRYHPTQKPLKLIERIIKASSNKGDIIIDPFAGSGTTLLASEKLKRKSFSIEMEKDYIESIKLRFFEEIC